MDKLFNQPCYDKEGNFIGWFSRSIAAVTFIFAKDKKGKDYVLASERGKGTPDFQGMWNCVCGYLDFNEKVADCAVRETIEECGVKISAKDLIHVGVEDNPTANHQNVTFRYVCVVRDKTIEEFTFSKKLNEKDEVGEIRWIPLDEVDNYEWAFGHEKLIKKYKYYALHYKSYCLIEKVHSWLRKLILS